MKISKLKLWTFNILQCFKPTWWNSIWATKKNKNIEEWKIYLTRKKIIVLEFWENPATKESNSSCSFTTVASVFPFLLLVMWGMKMHWKDQMSESELVTSHKENIQQMSFSILWHFRKLNLIQALLSKCYLLSSPFYCYMHKSFLIMSNLQGEGQL